MQILKKGDRCPCCGQEIQTEDLSRLFAINELRIHMDHRAGRISAGEAMNQSGDLLLWFAEEVDRITTISSESEIPDCSPQGASQGRCSDGTDCHGRSDGRPRNDSKAEEGEDG